MTDGVDQMSEINSSFTGDSGAMEPADGNGYVMRLAVPDDVPAIWNIILQAKELMKREGRCQWTDSYPLPETIMSDIERGYGHVLVYAHDGRIVAYGAVVFDGEPAYSDLDGQWNAEGPYVVLHRLAVAEWARGRGIAGLFFRMTEMIAIERGVRIFRVDTKHDNSYMLRVFGREGFRYCGEVSYARGDGNSARMAFDKLISKALSGCIL